MSAAHQYLLLSFSLSCSLLCILMLFRTRAFKRPLPPGPKRLPLIGNLLEYPQTDEAQTFKKWGDEYGEICSATVMGKTIIILNSIGVINELMEKRAALYSGRPKLWMAGELVGFKYMVTLTNDNEAHKKMRRLYNVALSNRAVREYEPVQTVEARKMIQRLLEMPASLENHVMRKTVAVILSVSHGYKVDSNDDQYIQLGKKVTDSVSKTFQPGAYAVNSFPFLRLLPSWFPGTSFLRDAEVWRAEWFQLAEQPFACVKADLAAGTAKKSFTSTLLEQLERNYDPEEEELIKWSAGTMYGAGSDTSAMTILTFFLAMMVYPNVQKKAQAELDAVVGQDRMPTLADKANLPYCSAIVKECLRWKPVAPTGVVHAAREEDTYNGFRIPKGALVIANIWATTRDSNIYPDPETFMPERFLADDCKTPRIPEGVREVGSFAFGFGRRICPGAAIAESTVFTAVVSALWTFDIRKKIGADGILIEPDVEYLSGVLSHPKPFEYDLKPRSEHLVKVLRQSLDAE